MRRFFRPELLGRVDEVIVFDKLGESELHSLANKLLNELCTRAAQMEISLEFAPDAVDALTREAAKSPSAARGLRHIITEKVENLLSCGLISGEIAKGCCAEFELKDGEFAVRVKEHV
ncbi:MAG: hypothetical protein NC078_05790 [Ruminococcus sp.]|nr:hypothetical protein [Ruminococcus sp.]